MQAALPAVCCCTRPNPFTAVGGVRLPDHSTKSELTHNNVTFFLLFHFSKIAFYNIIVIKNHEVPLYLLKKICKVTLVGYSTNLNTYDYMYFLLPPWYIIRIQNTGSYGLLLDA